MKTTEFITEAKVSAKILKDPRLTKMLAIAMRHDETLPKGPLARLGPKPSESALVQLYSDLLDKTLSNTEFGDLSSDGKFDDWLTRLYINGMQDFEDINGEAGTILGAWKALSIRNILDPKHQDFNKFPSLEALQSVLRITKYQEALQKLKDAAIIEKHKRERAEAVLIDNERYFVVIPFNYGACYTFSNAEGVNAQFCTGSSSGLYWFERYSRDGPIICVFDKSNAQHVDGKWQIHAATNQIVNAHQQDRHNVSSNSERFGKLFPGLMYEIVASMQSHANEIQEASQKLMRGGFDVTTAISDLRRKFPQAFTPASGKEEPNSEADTTQNQPARQGGYRVTNPSNGRTITVPANTEAEARQEIQRRYAGRTDLDQLEYERVNGEDVNESPDYPPVGYQAGGWKKYSPKPAGKVTEGDVVPMKKKKTEYDKYKDAFSKQHNDEHRHGVGYIECDYCGDVNCDYDCDGSQADGELEEDTAYAGGMGQGGNAGESYRKFTPKVAGSVTDEAANPAQQAAIAINMKKHHKKPKSVEEAITGAHYHLYDGKNFIKTFFHVDSAKAARDKLTKKNPNGQYKIVKELCGVGPMPTKRRSEVKEQGVAEGLSDTQKKIEDTILKLEQRLKFAKTPEQWDNIKNRIERLQAGLNRSKQGVAEGSAKHKQSRLWQMISDYEQRAKATKNEIKKQHYMKMADELRGKLKTSDDQGVVESVWDRPSKSYIPRDRQVFGQTNHPREEHCDSCGVATGHAGPDEDSNVDDDGNVYCDDCYANKQDVKEEKVRLDPKCWKGYHKQGTKMKAGVRVNNCVPNKSVKEAINVATKKKTKESSIMKGIVREEPTAHHYVLYVDGKPIMKAERGAADLEAYVERLTQKHPGVKVELKYEPVNSPKSVEETSSTGMGGGSAGIGGGSMVGGPTTYEQEYDPFKSKGPQRIRAMTYENK